MSGPPGIAEWPLRLSVPLEGVRAGDVVLRFPSLDKTLYSLLPGE